MPEEQLFKTEESRARSEIADVLADAAEQIEDGSVELASATETQRVTVPGTATLEVELERLTDSETGDQRYELEYEIHWSE